MWARGHPLRGHLDQELTSGSDQTCTAWRAGCRGGRPRLLGAVRGHLPQGCLLLAALPLAFPGTLQLPLQLSLGLQQLLQLHAGGTSRARSEPGSSSPPHPRTEAQQRPSLRQGARSRLEGELTACVGLRVPQGLGAPHTSGSVLQVGRGGGRPGSPRRHRYARSAVPDLQVPPVWQGDLELALTSAPAVCPADCHHTAGPVDGLLCHLGHMVA